MSKCTAVTCVLFRNGSAACVGASSDVPTGLGTMVQISVGHPQVCVLLMNASIVCWGLQPSTPPSDLGPVKAIAAGIYQVCALLVSGQLRCWSDEQLPSQLCVTCPVRKYETTSISLDCSGTTPQCNSYLCSRGSVKTSVLPICRLKLIIHVPSHGSRRYSAGTPRQTCLH
jgi:hypothetical protein